MIHSTQRPKKVILAEFNEITWRFIEPLCAQGKLPTFAEFMRHGTKGSPVATEVPPHLDPWIAWTTVYTGRPQEEHGVRFLEQPPETVQGPKLWEIAANEGKSIGVYGSIMSWPPRHDIRGFWVPSTFSPTTATYPPELKPIQELNLGQTRGHTPLKSQSRLTESLTLLRRLFGLGLKPSTLTQIASFLLRSRINRHCHWEKVSLQPLVNLDFFEKLYRQHRPELATFHTNHVAHYMHRYWRAADPSPFLTKPSPTEVSRYGKAVEFGYQSADRVLRRLWNLVDEQTVVILASGLGQQPYVSEDFRDGRQVVRIRDIDTIVGLCGVEGRCKAISMMAPQWNLEFQEMEQLRKAERVLESAWVGSADVKLFAYDVVGNTINFNIGQKNFKTLDMDAPCVFPDAAGRTLKLGELCAVQDATPKQGYHDPVGMVLLRGPGIRQGAQLEACTNLDLAPTILHLMGMEVPAHMRGRVLEEAFESRTSVAVPSMA